MVAIVCYSRNTRVSRLFVAIVDHHYRTMSSLHKGMKILRIILKKKCSYESVLQFHVKLWFQ